MGSCDYTGFNVFDITVGTHILTVYMWDHPGTCELPIDVSGGSEYFFEIKPRTGSLVGVFIPYVGILGAAIESAGKQCGGAFSVEPIDKDLAIPKLVELKKTQ